MISIHRFFCVAILAAFLAPAAAQPVPGSDGEPPRRISACYLFAQQAPELFYRTAEGEYKPMKIGTHGFGAPAELPADQQTFTLYRKIEIPSETGGDPSEEFRELKSYELPSGERNLRLLFYFDAGGRTRDLLLTDPEAARKSFTVHVLNILPEPVAVRVGDARDSIAPQSSKIFTPVAETDQRFPFTFARRDESDRGYTTSNTDQLSFIRENQRLMIVVGYRPQFAYEVQELPTNEGLIDDESAPPPDPGPARLQSLEVDAIRVYDFL